VEELGLIEQWDQRGLLEEMSKSKNKQFEGRRGSVREVMKRGNACDDRRESHSLIIYYHCIQSSEPSPKLYSSICYETPTNSQRLLTQNIYEIYVSSYLNEPQIQHIITKLQQKETPPYIVNR